MRGRRATWARGAAPSLAQRTKNKPRPAALTTRHPQPAIQKVVLDLDETLIAAFPEPAPPPPARTPAPSVVVTADLGDGAAGPVRAYVRPGLHAFLARLAEFADVVLFTAGLPGVLGRGLGPSPAAAAPPRPQPPQPPTPPTRYPSGYAGPLCDALDPGGTLLPVRLFRPSTVAAGGHVCVKDLSALGRDLGRTVLVDNSPWSFLLQPSCGLPALPFYGDGDDECVHCRVSMPCPCWSPALVAARPHPPPPVSSNPALHPPPPRQPPAARRAAAAGSASGRPRRAPPAGGALRHGVLAGGAGGVRPV